MSNKLKQIVTNKREFEKAKRRLRFAKTKQKNYNRVKAYKNQEYSYGSGYHIKNSYRENIYEIIDVPEKIIPERYFLGTYYPEKVIPAHKRKSLKASIVKNIPDRLVRVDLGKSKKYYRKLSSRKVRHYKNELNSNGYFKKIFDYWWNLL